MHWKSEGTQKAKGAECLTMCDEESGKEREDKKLHGLKRRRGSIKREQHVSSGIINTIKIATEGSLC
eukprot:554198-Rhodomonas_salina.1